MLDELIKNQLTLQELIKENHAYKFTSNEDMIQKYMAYIVGETDEVNREVNYKHWKPKKEVDWLKVQEELSDIFIFWLDLIIKLGMEQYIFDIAAVKQKENIKRQKGESKEKDYRRI